MEKALPTRNQIRVLDTVTNLFARHNVDAALFGRKKKKNRWILVSFTQDTAHTHTLRKREHVFWNQEEYRDYEFDLLLRRIQRTLP
jgi:hypothetical protein